MSTDEHDDGSVYDLSLDDDDPTVHELSTTGDREAMLAEALAHAATQEAHYRQPPLEEKRSGRWKTPLSMVVFVLSAYLLLAPPPWLAGEDSPAVSQSARTRGVRAALFLQAQQVEAFRVRHGRLPDTLEETGSPMAGIQFVRSNNRVFQLVAQGPNGSSIIYDSGRSTDEFVEATAGWGVSRP